MKLRQSCQKGDAFAVPKGQLRTIMDVLIAADA